MADSLLDLERSLSQPKPRQRVQMLRLLKIGHAETLPEVATLVGLSANHAATLWRCYRDKGLSGLLETHYQGRIPRLNAEQVAALEQESAKGFRLLHASQQWIEEQFSHSYSLPGVWQLFRRMGVKKTGRHIFCKRTGRIQNLYSVKSLFMDSPAARQTKVKYRKRH